MPAGTVKIMEHKKYGMWSKNKAGKSHSRRFHSGSIQWIFGYLLSVYAGSPSTLVK